MKHFLGCSKLFLSFLLLIAITPVSFAQLNGDYTIGDVPGPRNFPTIEASITALNAQGVNGAVVMKIKSGTYTPPTSSGWILGNVNGMSNSNTVTFRPADSASVELSGSCFSQTNLIRVCGIFRLKYAHHFIIEGSNGSLPVTRNMLIRNTSSNSAIGLASGSNRNIIRNCIIQTSGSFIEGPCVIDFMCDGELIEHNTIENNQIGDYEGIFGGSTGIQLWHATSNCSGIANNQILKNDIINIGVGIYVSRKGSTTIIKGNSIHHSSGVLKTVAGGILNSGRQSIIDGNRFFGYTGNSVEGSLFYGIHSTVDSRIINNMISFQSDGHGRFYGIRIQTDGGDENDSVHIKHNSIFVSS
ncbi:MAG TPA: hypothetical protein VM101_03500, partial [Flavitalea sp.]|nr:hypothetical protein [Flavitalea sp.]